MPSRALQVLVPAHRPLGPWPWGWGWAGRVRAKGRYGWEGMDLKVGGPLLLGPASLRLP